MKSADKLFLIMLCCLVLIASALAVHAGAQRLSSSGLTF